MSERRRWIGAVAAALFTATLVFAPSSAGAAALHATIDAHTQATKSDRALEVQRRLQESRAANDRAVRRLGILRRHLADRAEQAERAAADADSTATGVDSSSGVLDVVSTWATGDDQLDRAHEAMRNAHHLDEIEKIVKRGVARARKDVRATAGELRAARAAADRLELSMAARASARLALSWSSLGPDYHASGPAQDQRNRRALAGWRRHLRAMGAAGIAPPGAEALERRRLPGGLRPARDGSGRPIAGVALARARDGVTLDVVPDVTVRAVSAAFASLGVVSEDARSCSEFVRDLWSTAQVDVPADSRSMWESLTPVPDRHVVEGDVVFFRRADEHGIGLSVGGGLVVALDPTSAEVGVERVPPSDVIAARRVTLSAGNGTRPGAAPPLLSDGCTPPGPGSPTLPVGSADGWVLPVPESSFSMSAGFGTAGRLWSSGHHTGQDFAAPTGTPVLAAAAGRVTVEPASWAGQLVRVDHGGGVETWYAHMSRVDVSSGATVEAGTVLGAVGSEGNSTGPHLHFEVRLSGVPTDPMTFLAQRIGAGQGS